LIAFHYRSYGTFFLHKNKLHNIYRGFTHYKYYRASFSDEIVQNLAMIGFFEKYGIIVVI
ncbi:hypothetical protein ACRE14_09430, partial [Streptococcus pneumoniae]